MEEKKLTGYPSIDKPWLKYYSEEAISAPLPSSSIYQYIISQNNGNLADTAIRYFKKRISFRELFANIDRVANAITSLGIKPGDVVAVCMPAIPEAVYIVYALNKIGAIPNMLDPRYNEALLEYCLQEAPSSLLLTYDGCYEKFLNISKNICPQQIVLISALLSMPCATRLLASLRTDIVKPQRDKHMLWNSLLKLQTSSDASCYDWTDTACCMILHTGGTTGNPKGVMLSNRSINAIAHQYRMLVNPKKGGILLDIIPPFASYGLCTSMHMPLSLGLSIEMIPRFDANRFGDLLVKYKPNYVMGVPSFYESMLSNKKLKREDMSYLLSAACGGDSINIPTEKRINDFLETHHSSAHIDMGYGMSEMSATACVCVSFKGIHRPGSIGIPFGNTTFKIVNPETLEECKYNETGEICITGPGMMIAYLKNKELTRKTIRNHNDGIKWIHTGDLGHITEDGFIFHDGRIKRMIVRYDGFKIYPSAVEQAIMRHPDVQSCAVIKVTKEGLGAIAKGYVVLQAGVTDKGIVLSEIMQNCKADLAERSVPEDFEFVTQLPLTSMGKIDYRALEKQADETNIKTE